MEYRNWDNLGAQPSLLGFGCMRFPKRADGSIDEPEAERMLNRAKQAGINYFDTAWGYHSGACEPFLGKAIAKWDRESFYLATKLPTYAVETLDDAKDFFEQQRRRLGVEYFDFYLLHTLNGPRFQKMVDLGVVDWCLELQRQGKIKRFGFSFHDGYAAFAQILAHHKWDFCQIQLNYMDTDAEEQASMKGYELAASQGVPVIIMEPVRGGGLAQLPDAVLGAFRREHPEWSNAAWALRWAADLPNVMTVLSGMSSMEQLEENLATFGDLRPLTRAEHAAVEETAAAILSRTNNPCTACRYCMPCPSGVDIPVNFRIWNQYGMYRNTAGAVQSWKFEIKDEARAKNCVGCGACEKLCPQSIDIRRDLARLQSELDALPDDAH